MSSGSKSRAVASNNNTSTSSSNDTDAMTMGAANNNTSTNAKPRVVVLPSLATTTTTSTATSATTSSSTTTTTTSSLKTTTNHTNPPLRTFETAGGWIRFRVSRQRLLDSVMDGINWGVESLVYLIGPILIVLALGIIVLLSFTFFTILIPMMQLKYNTATSMMGQCIIAAHCIWVVFLLINILFNYYNCVRTRHNGPAYEAVVRQLADAVGVDYPETPQQLEVYKKDFEDRMILRMRRRHARMINQQQQHNHSGVVKANSTSATTNTTSTSVVEDVSSSPSSSTGMTHRRQSQQQPTSTMTRHHHHQSVSSTSSSQPPQTPLRSWMLLAPYEFGYCANSNQPKPPRSHYDHVTKQLVLNLDHYCPWMFNSIGYFNYRYFVNFLLYIFVGMLYGALITLEPFLLLTSPAYHEQLKQMRHAGGGGGGTIKRIPRLQPMLAYSDEKMFVTLAFMLCLAVGFAVFLLASFHVYLTCTAQTTIEFHANWAHRKRARANGQKWKNPYSVGTYKGNWQRVYGDMPHLFNKNNNGSSNNNTRVSTVLACLMAMLPSSRPPQFLPVPIPGHDGRVRSPLQQQLQEEANNNNKLTSLATTTKHQMHHDDDLETSQLLPDTISDAV